MRYDACIIGAGAEGLACAAWLAGRGKSVVVVEREPVAGGRCTTRLFAPGYRASPYADELAAIPARLFRAFELGRRGAIFVPREGPPDALASLRGEVIDRLLADAAAPARRSFFRRSPPPSAFPGAELAARPLAEIGSVAALAPSALCDTALAGSALSLLAGPPGGMPAGGLGRLGAALRAAAEEAGATVSCGLEVTDIRRRGGRAVAVGLSDGSEIGARAIVSSLDLKRTFLSLFTWSELPKTVVERIAAFRPAPGIARLLVALGSPPQAADPFALRKPIRLWDAADAAYHAWRNGVVPQRPPVELRVVSAVDPFLAPDGAATLTVTLAAIPHSPFNGPWDHAKRNALRETALAMMEEALPGTRAKVVAAELIVPPDIEAQLGLTEGDLAGGELSAPQMLASRPFAGFGCEFRVTRTPVAGLYLAGPSSALGPLATCASGVAAGEAVLADLAAGRI